MVKWQDKGRDMKDNKKFFVRKAIYSDGRVEEILVERAKVIKEIDQMLKKDKEMLDILKKL